MDVVKLMSTITNLENMLEQRLWVTSFKDNLLLFIK